MQNNAKSRRPVRNECVQTSEAYLGNALWTGAVVYAVWAMFHETWTWPWRHRSDLRGEFFPPDSEWHTFSRVLLKVGPAYFVHAGLSRLLDVLSTRSKLVSTVYRPPWFHLAFTLVTLHLVFGYNFVKLVLIVHTTLTALSFVNNVYFTWLGALSSIYFIVTSPLLDIAADNLGVDVDDGTSAIISVMTSWNVLKFISLSRDGDLCKNFFVRLGYLLYLPTLVVGPPVLFPTYLEGLKKSRRYGGQGLSSTEDLKVLALRLLRYCFWALALEFVYSGWDFHYLAPPSAWGLWAVCGLGYWLGQALMMKYVVFYGIASIFARFEGIDAPPAPYCIGRIARYSDMWRHFDVGLNQFLVRYVYVPVVKKTKQKVLAVIASFGLVYLWHAMTTSVAIWVTINAAGILMENVLDSSVFPHMKSPRKRCAVLAVLMAASCFSNFYFLGGYAVGSGIFWRVVESSWYAKFWIWFFLYNCCTGSAYIFEHEN